MNKITKNIEQLAARHSCAADAAQTLRRQMATTGRPVVTFNQLVTEALIASGAKDLGWAKVCSSIMGEMISQEQVDSMHTREVCIEFLRRNIATGRIRVAQMGEVFRSYTDGSCRTAGKPFVRVSIMGQVRDALDVIAFTQADTALGQAARTDSLMISEKLGKFADCVRSQADFVDEGGGEALHVTDEEILVAMDDDYVAA